jgi:hypothetical protein
MRLCACLLSTVLLTVAALADERAIKDASQAKRTFEKAWAQDTASQTNAEFRKVITEIIKKTDPKNVRCSLSETNAAYKMVSEHHPALPKLAFYYGKPEDLKGREVWLIIYAPNYLTFLHAALDPATGKVICIWYYHDTCG